MIIFLKKCFLIRVNCLTIEETYECVSKDILGFEKIKFTKNKYKRFLEKNTIVENYSKFLELHEKKFLQKYKKNKLPMLIRENYIVKKNQRR